MTCILIEGEEGKGEYIFWDTLVKNFMVNTKLIGVGGNKQLKPAMISLLKQNVYDSFLICYDLTVMDSTYLSILDSLKYIKNVAYKISPGIKIGYLDNYCFEDCLLLNNRLLPWLFSEQRWNRQKEQEIIQVVTEYQRLYSIHGTINIYQDNYLLTLLKSYNIIKNFNNLTGERLASQILDWATRITVFQVKKGKISNCWLCTCHSNECYLDNYILKNPKGVNHIDSYKCGLHDNYSPAVFSENYKMHNLLIHSPILSQLRNVKFLQWKPI